LKSVRVRLVSPKEGVKIANDGGSWELLTDENGALVLVDYQHTMFKSVTSVDKARIKKAAIYAVKAANILGISVVLSSINPKYKNEAKGWLVPRHLGSICLSGAICSIPQQAMALNPNSSNLGL
jgi:hypothetical protein